MAEITQKITKNTPKIIAIVLFVVAAAGLFMFVFPEKDSLDVGKTQLLQKQSELQRVKSNVSRLNAVESSFKGSEVTQKDILNSIPENLEQEVVIRTLAKLASDSEISLNSMSFSLSEERDIELSTLTITTNISGKHQNLVNFIEGVEESGRKMIVKNISVQTLENFLENMSVTIEAYTL